MTGTLAEQSFGRAEELLRRMQVRESAALFRQAELAGSDPDSCSAGLWKCHMLLGDFEAAWRESDLIARRGKVDPYSFWDGQPIDGRKVLIRCLHGLGDTIQFIRYAPLIRQRAKSLVIEAQPSLKKLVAEAELADEVITWGEREPPWDQQIEVVELPRIFRTTLQTIPQNVPYMGRRLAHKQHVGFDFQDGRRALRVGLVWESSAFDPSRSIKLQDLEPLFAVLAISLFSFQAGPERKQLKPWSSKIVDVYDESGCITTAARNIETMDLLVTVDTMIAHLAGAVGCPVWVLLPYACDWRWMIDRNDSPWYPAMRLFRQESAGDWKSVVARLVECLVQTMDHRPPGFEHQLA